MAANSTENRVEQLATGARELIQQGQLDGAVQALREASSIDPSSPSVKDAWSKLEIARNDAKLVTLCEAFVQSKVDKDADSALDYLFKHSVSDEILEAAMDTLMEYSGDSDSADELTGQLLKSLPAKRVLASALKSSPTTTFNKIFERGDDSMDGQANLLLDHTAWQSQHDRIAAERDVFQLALAQLMKAGQDFPERAMRTLSRLLGAEASNLNGLIDADGFDVILTNLDIRLPSTLRAQAALACLKLLELSQDTAKSLISQYVVDRVQTPSGERLVQAFSAAAAVFPMAPSAASELFLKDGFLPNFVQLINKWKSQRVEQAALQLLNSACIDGRCREAIRKYCPEWLHSISSSVDSGRRASQTAMANLVLEKIKDAQSEGEKSPSDVDDRRTQERFRRFKTLILEKDTPSQSRATAFEGLAFASISPAVKEDLAHDPAFLKRVIHVLGDDADGTSVYGGLSVMVNLSSYRPVLSEEQKRMTELKAYAAPVKPAAPSPLDDDVHVTKRCTLLLNSGVVPLFTKCLKSWSPSSTSLAIQITNSLAKEKSHRGQLAQQGALKLLLNTYDRMVVENDPRLPILLSAAHAVARILISVNPSHAFTSSSPSISSAVRPLTTLLTPEESSDSTIDFLPTFEALLALTNLASIDESTCKLIIQKAWTPAEDLLLSQNVLVQRAATELVCNLCACPQGAAQFSTTKQSNSRLQVVLALSDSEDLPTRKAASGALAMLTEWEPVLEILGSLDTPVPRLIRILLDENNEVSLRGAVSLRNCALVGGTKWQAILRESRCQQSIASVMQRANAGMKEVLTELSLLLLRAH